MNMLQTDHKTVHNIEGQQQFLNCRIFMGFSKIILWIIYRQLNTALYELVRNGLWNG